MLAKKLFEKSYGSKKSYSCPLFYFIILCGWDRVYSRVADLTLLILLPGSTISSSDFADILRRSSHLPPKLPSRPPTLRLNPADSQSSKVHIRPALSVYSGGHTDIDAYNNEQIRLSASEGKTVNTNAAYIPDVPVSEAQPVERLRRTEYVDKPVKSTSAAHTVKLPTRDTSSRSILKK